MYIGEVTEMASSDLCWNLATMAEWSRQSLLFGKVEEDRP